MSAELYLIQFLGFMVQTLPVAVMFFFILDEEMLRMKKRRLYTVFALGLMGAGVIFSLIVGMLYHKVSSSRMDIDADLLMLMALIIFVLFGLWVTRESWSKRIFSLIIVIFYEAVVYTLASVVMHILLVNFLGSHTPYSIYNVIVLSALTVPTFFLMYRFLTGRVKEILRLMDDKRIVRICAYVGVELFLYCCFMFFPPNFDDKGIFMMILCYIVANVLILGVLFGEIHVVQKQAALEENLRVFGVEYQAIYNNIQEMQHFQHDMRHHLRVISTLNTEGKREELSEYLNQYINVYDDYKNDQLCNYPLINTILKYYVEKARRSGIQVKNSIALNEELGFDFMDMTVLLGNCLENAIEAAVKMPGDKRWMHVDMMKVRGAMLIMIENSCMSGKVIGDGGFLPADKFRSISAGGFRGYGTDNIKNIAEKYHGSVDFKQQEHVFAVRVVLYVQ